ncbi:MAG: hypothetical protein CME65_02305 [Halobacteriovoraceae bacterium]|nr:hypothetical protein [Halobacteriovoraceae bacterium]|tara:strand:- start:3843 stop:4472 length:630 start_codon:yes stop_codon:yes gene_type:complete
MATPKLYAPLLRVAAIHDAGANIGDIASWDPDTTSPAGSGLVYGLVVTNTNNLTTAPAAPFGHMMAEKVWNSVWNDYADFQFLGEDKYTAGKAYYDTVEGARLCTSRCQMGVMGIASDTFAHIVGQVPEENQIPIAVAGWVLAHVDKEYECGVALTNDENGNLTQMTIEEKQNFPERLIAVYKKPEIRETFGTASHQIKVDGRHWVQVK